MTLSPATEALLRRGFRLFNKFFMVPIFRLGLGPLLGTPFGGYFMILKTVGRKTGLVRSTPVNYAILGGDVYCLAGFGPRTHWYRNLKAHPGVELLLPGRAMAGVAEEVEDGDRRLLIIRQVLQNGGFAGYVYGNPHTISDAHLAEQTNGVPVIRIRPTGVGSDPADPGGHLWLWWLVVPLLLLWPRWRNRD